MTPSRAYGWAQSFQRKRSARSREMDAKRKARQTFGEDLGTEDYRRWKRHPGKYDIEGIDTPPKKRRGGFFDGVGRRRSSYADLPWVEDPYTARMIAGEDLDDQMVEAYQKAVYDELDRQMYGDVEGLMFHSRRKRRRGHGRDSPLYDFRLQNNGIDGMAGES